MTETPKTGLMFHVLGGAFAGAVLGFVADFVLTGRPTEGEIRVGYGPMIGAVPAAMLGVVTHRRPLPAWVTRPTLGFFAGAAAGGFLGKFVAYPIVMTIHLDGRPWFDGKFSALRYMPFVEYGRIGALAGVVPGMASLAFSSRQAPHTSTE